jgi:glucan exporter ATP-binding protein
MRERPLPDYGAWRVEDGARTRPRAAIRAPPAAPYPAVFLSGVGETALEWDDFLFESSSHSNFLLEHDLFRKLVSTFRDHALEWWGVPNVQRSGMRLLRLYLRVLELLGREARLGWVLAIANLALAAAMFMEPVLFGRIVDTLANSQGRLADLSLPRLFTLVGAWAGFGVFTIVTSALVALHADRLAHRQRQVVLTDFFEHVLQLPLAYHNASHSGRLMKVMLTGTNALWGLWLWFFRENLAAFVSLIVLLPLALALNWRFGLMLVALCCIFAILIALVIRKSEQLQQKVEQYYTDVAERTSDTLGNVALVQSFARVEVEVSGMRKVGDLLLSAQMPVLSWWAAAAVLTRTSTTLTVLAILFLGIWLYLDGVTTVGEIVMFISFAGLLITRLEQVVQFANRMLLDAPRLTEFFDVMDTEPAVRDRPDAVDPGRLHGLVEFDRVSYSYDGKRAAVADLSFTALPGETVALVGATGAGKSTALALLHRAFDPQSGSVKIDGMDIRGLSLSGLRHNIAVVFQEALLFNRSIAENLRVGKADATIEEMRAACARAQVLDLIERQAGGFETKVGERGRLLSGGERQRFAIARALLKDPPILILDEATSSLDSLTEAKVQAALDEVMKGRTTFVIAHRLATVRNATRILFLQEGRIVEAGNFDELTRLHGQFAEVARTQFMIPPAKPMEQEHSQGAPSRSS